MDGGSAKGAVGVDGRRESQGLSGCRWTEGAPRVRWASVDGAINFGLPLCRFSVLSRNRSIRLVAASDVGCYEVHSYIPSGSIYGNLATNVNNVYRTTHNSPESLGLQGQLRYSVHIMHII